MSKGWIQSGDVEERCYTAAEGAAIGLIVGISQEYPLMHAIGITFAAGAGFFLYTAPVWDLLWRDRQGLGRDSS